MFVVAARTLRTLESPLFAFLRPTVSHVERQRRFRTAGTWREKYMQLLVIIVFTTLCILRDGIALCVSTVRIRSESVSPFKAVRRGLISLARPQSCFAAFDRISWSETTGTIIRKSQPICIGNRSTGGVETYRPSSGSCATRCLRWPEYGLVRLSSVEYVAEHTRWGARRHISAAWAITPAKKYNDRRKLRRLGAWRSRYGFYGDKSRAGTARPRDDGQIKNVQRAIHHGLAIARIILLIISEDLLQNAAVRRGVFFNEISIITSSKNIFELLYLFI